MYTRITLDLKISIVPGGLRIFSDPPLFRVTWYAYTTLNTVLLLISRNSVYSAEYAKIRVLNATITRYYSVEANPDELMV